MWLQQNGHHAQVNCSCYMVHARTMPQLELNNPHISMLQATHCAGANAASSCTSKPCALCGAAGARHKCGGCMAVRFATLLAPNTPNMPTLFAGAVVGIASGCTGGSMGGNAAWWSNWMHKIWMRMLWGWWIWIKLELPCTNASMLHPICVVTHIVCLGACQLLPPGVNPIFKSMGV